MATPQYRFRNFLLDPAARELREDDRLIALPTSALDCLAYLVEHRERAVGRDELIAAVWGRIDVADTLLAQTIRRIRRELGDTGDEQYAIRTVQRFGYRWVAETRIESDALDADTAGDVSTTDAIAVIEEVHAEPAAVPILAAPDASRNPLRQRRPWLVAALVVVAIMMAAVPFVRQMLRQSESDTASTTVIGAVVLPAEVAQTTEWGWLRLGLMDLVAGRLRQGGLTTMSSESVLALLGQAGAGRDPLDDAELVPAAALRIHPQAEFRDGAWRVQLDVRHNGESLAVEASAGDVLQAARHAADLLLVKTGYKPPPPAGSTESLAIDELLQRTKAATLADQFDLARRLIEQAPAELRNDPAVVLRLAQIDVGQGEYERAELQLVLLLDRVSADSDVVLRGRMLNTLGGVQARLGRLAEADATYTESLRLLEPVRDADGLGLAYAGLASIASLRGDQEAAATDFGRARVELEAAGNELGVAQVELNLGLVTNLRYRPAEALPLLRGVESRLIKLGAHEELAYARFGIVGVQLRLLDVDGARATSDTIWPPDAHMGNQSMRWVLFYTRAQVLVAQGQLAAAENVIAQIGASAGDEPKAFVAATRAQIAQAAGRYEDAARLAANALTPALESADVDQYLSIWLMRLRALRASAPAVPVTEEVARLHAWIDARPNDWRRACSSLADAEQAWSTDRHEAALSAFADAMVRTERVGIPSDVVEVASRYLFALIASGKLDQAGAIGGKVAAYADRDLRAATSLAGLYHAMDRTDAWRTASANAVRLAGERVMPSVAGY
jgi:DNA-binding winged helix-turn-helix (wHTH) protein/tetratricopeptide (TPR) repeat protein